MQHRKTKQAKNIKVKFKKMESRTMRSRNNLFEVPQGEKLTRKSQDVRKSWLKFFPELMKHTYPHILESQPTPKQEEEKENSLPQHTVVKLQNNKHKTTTMKAAEGKDRPTQRNDSDIDSCLLNSNYGSQKTMEETFSSTKRKSLLSSIEQKWVK